MIQYGQAMIAKQASTKKLWNYIWVWQKWGDIASLHHLLWHAPAPKHHLLTQSNFQLQESLASGVTTLHYDSMFSYWKHLKSRKLKFLVKSAYKNLAIAQHYITRRNRRRYIEGLLTNPFMTRNWMPSSICTWYSDTCTI